MPETLDGKAVDWSRPPHNDPVAEVVIGPVRYVGRVSGLLDADTEGRPGDLRDYRPVYPARCPIDKQASEAKGRHLLLQALSGNGQEAPSAGPRDTEVTRWLTRR
jgi:hypothetical protein